MQHGIQKYHRLLFIMAKSNVRDNDGRLIAASAIQIANAIGESGQAATHLLTHYTAHISESATEQGMWSMDRYGVLERGNET